MEDSELFSVESARSSPENLVEIATAAEPFEINDLYVAESVEVINTDDSIICLDEDEASAECSDVPLDLSSMNLPVIMPSTLDCSDSSTRSYSNDNDDDFCIIFEKKAPPLEVEILENYVNPNTQTKKKIRKSHNPRPSEQYECNNYSRRLEVTEQTNTLLDDSISVIEKFDRLQSASRDSTEKKKRKIECGVCFDGPDEMEANDKSLVSTVCGHIFCSECIKVSIKSFKHCPQCRRKLTMKQFHALYV